MDRSRALATELMAIGPADLDEKDRAPKPTPAATRSFPRSGHGGPDRRTRSGRLSPEARRPQELANEINCVHKTNFR